MYRLVLLFSLLLFITLTVYHVRCPTLHTIHKFGPQSGPHLHGVCAAVLTMVHARCLDYSFDTGICALVHL
jgi:hypothetical protein